MYNYAMVDRIPLFVLNKAKLKLSDKQLIVLCAIESFRKLGNFYPTPTDISENVGFTEKEAEIIMAELIGNRMLDIKNKNGSLTFSTDNVVSLVLGTDTNKKQKSLHSLFELKVGRELQSIEIEIISGWQEDGITYAKMEKILSKVSFTDNKIPYAQIESILKSSTK